MTRIGSALEAKQRPTAALLELDDPNSGWTPMDWRLQEAYWVLDRERCPQCGNAVWYCHSTDNRIDFVVSKRICYAKAEIGDYEKTNSRDELGAGEYYIAVAAGLENEDKTRDPLPSRHEALAKLQ